jgi:hypothetical protein
MAAADVEPEVEEEMPVAEMDEVPAEPGLPGLPVLFLVLAMVGLASVAVMPFLGNTEFSKIGDLRAKVGNPPPVKPEAQPYVIGVPLAGVVLALVGLILSARKGRFGLAALLTTYPVWLLSLALALFAGVLLLIQLDDAAEAQAIFAKFRQQGFGGELTFQIGSAFWVAAAGTTAATLFFTLALFFIHQKRWSRIVFLVLACLLLGGGGALVPIMKADIQKGKKAALRDGESRIYAAVTVGHTGSPGRDGPDGPE